jgi:hypothetical protein
MAPQINTGLFMTYNVKMWKVNEMNPEWLLYAGLYAIPNASKLKADSNYMNAIVEVENKNYTINQLNSWQNQLLPMDSIDKKIKIVNDNLLLLEYMIKVWKYAISITWTNCPPIIRPNPI